MVQLSHPHMTTGKTVALPIWSYVDNVMYLFFNTVSGFVITVLPRSKRLSVFMAAVTVCSDFGAKENKVFHWFHCSTIY